MLPKVKLLVYGIKFSDSTHCVGEEMELKFAMVKVWKAKNLPVSILNNFISQDVLSLNFDLLPEGSIRNLQVVVENFIEIRITLSASQDDSPLWRARGDHGKLDQIFRLYLILLCQVN